VADLERVSALATDPSAELARVEAEIRANPSDPRLRTYLFQILALRGDWQRALSQLQVTAQLSASAIPMAQTCREAIRAEAFRVEVFAGRRQPQILGEPPPWVGGLVESLRLLGEGRVREAEQMRADALERAPETPGRIGTAEFSWIADADSRLGPVCEAIVDGKYVWIPFARVARITVDPPTDLRDFVWAGARVTFTNGGDTVALIPTRYPASEASGDPAIVLARKTTWQLLGESTYTGLGQRMWATDKDEYPLLDAREITLAEGEQI